MDLTVIAVTLAVAVGGGFAVVTVRGRPSVLAWARVGGKLFLLATRDLFRSRDRSRTNRQYAAESDGDRPESSERIGADVPQRTGVVARVRESARAVTGWFG